MNRILFIYLVLSCQNLFGQAPTLIEWGPENLVNNRIGLVLPDQQLDFYVAEINQTLFNNSSYVSRYELGKKVRTKKIKTNYNNSISTIEEIISFRGQLLVFLSNKKGGVKSLFMVQYDNELIPIDEPIQVANFVCGQKNNSKGEFSVIKSDKENYLCVNYFVPGKNEQKDLIGFTVFDSLFHVTNTKEFELPFTPEFSAIEAKHLSNTGTFAIGLSIFNYTSNGLWKDYSKIEKSMVYYTNSDSLIHTELFIDKNRIYNYQIHSIENDSINELFITGTYGEEANGGAKEVFFQRINLLSPLNSIAKVFEFPSLLLEEETEKNRLDFLDYSTSNYRIDNQLLNYAFRNVFPQSDGGIVICAEQYYFYEQATTDARGMTQMVNHYQYNDLLIYKIDSSGNFSWIKKIPKSQHSINDYGYFLSTKVIENKGFIYCYFNDIEDNYDELGNYNHSTIGFNFPVRKKECVLTEVTIDLTTSQENRHIISRTADTDGFVSLKISQVNKRRNEMLFYSTRLKDKFGILSF